MHSDVATMRKVAYGVRLHELYQKKDSGLSGSEIWLQLLIVFLILPSAFNAFERYKNLLHMILGVQSSGQNMTTDLCIRLIGGGLAGITAASATYPLDLVRTRLAAQTSITYYKGIGHALRTISREEGVFGLNKRLGATLLGVGSNLAISLSVYDTVRSYWLSQRPHDSTVLVSLACGSLSGVASSTVTFPLDLARRRMQDMRHETMSPLNISCVLYYSL